MTINNRRLREIQTQKQIYQELLDEATSINDCLIYQGKLDCLNHEEEEILEKYQVII